MYTAGMFQLFRRDRPYKTAAALIAIAGLIGMIDSTFLVLQYLAALAHPGEATPCTVNAFVSCTKTVQGPWAHYFPSFPNPLLGMLWYSAFAAYGIGRFFGSSHTRNARIIAGIILLAGLAFSYRLYIASVLELGGVCPFCLLSTTMSTLLALAFVVDDRSYADPIIGHTGLWFVHAFQIFSVLAFVVGLSWFLAWSISWMPDPAPALTHWSFPVMVVLVLTMISGHAWAFLRLRKKA